MFKVKFADIGEGLTEGKVAEVLVKLGQEIKEGDALFFVETDKVNSEIPAPVGGKIAKVLISEGQEIKVGDVVIEIDDGSATVEAAPAAEEENASVVGSTPVSNDLIPSRGPAPTQNVAAQPTPAPVATKHTDIEESFDVIVVGAGIGGYVSAIKTAQLGLKTLIIEKQYYGGVCLNVGCIPTKSLLRTAKVFEDIVHKAANLGIDMKTKDEPSINWNKALERKDGVVNKLTGGVKVLLTKNGVKQIIGEASALDKNTISVNGKKYHCDNLIIASGSVPNELPLPGFAEGRESGFLIDSTKILSLPKIPKTLTVIGGGVIGIEFGCLFAALGTKVTVIEGAPKILPMLDQDVTALMTKTLKEKYKIEIFTNAKVKEVKGKSVVFEIDGKEQTVKSDYCLESIGRKTVTKGFDGIGLELSERKSIIANDYGETNLEGVYAIGDVTSKIMLAHVASHAGIVTANRIALKANKPDAHDIKIDYSKIPSCIYSHPEIAMIGKTEQQLKEEGVEYKTFKFPFAAIGKALADDDTTGFVKIICEPKYKTLLGAHIIGNRATDMISEFTTLIECEGTITELARAIHPHPTMSEAIGEAAEALESGKSLNL
ncbi:Dihydrolipoamide dehydrogenase of pyruvate dehydrogenase complex [Mesoplasma florum W37]|uniref:Dihydrolipoyl dehydrogenase n=1 Tax=Mesoplasma florum TaxID=2151 RepID=A0AAD2JDP6_MESFO|nr:dihydrolipoyl dehydrogenase [Mesoplasma florum]AGY41112.1 Dihydrolipoamide dehydrogenase of pyruvate dehydrogenase complex [Mesoplasma florum W37]AVN59343.1 dihydrolipoyl dehydrogenase [Mesoplasma florum]AVN65450.1 Dihydrolipoamide dehydrogenase of pyruvate dehydrogenase complex [Mesoplasma florum]